LGENAGELVVRDVEGLQEDGHSPDGTAVDGTREEVSIDSEVHEVRCLYGILDSAIQAVVGQVEVPELWVVEGRYVALERTRRDVHIVDDGESDPEARNVSLEVVVSTDRQDRQARETAERRIVRESGEPVVREVETAESGALRKGRRKRGEAVHVGDDFVDTGTRASRAQ